MSAYHEGEIALQQLTGARDAARRLEAAISGTVPERVRKFVPTVETVATCIMSPDDRVWTSLWSGSAGFLGCSADGDTITIDRRVAHLPDEDPVMPFCQAGNRFGMLAIDFSTRRRLRINGDIVAVDQDGVMVQVRECFVNCPKFIQKRFAIRAGRSRPPSTATSGAVLDPERIAIVERADTAFIATTHPSRGLDVSHRGGEPGFIRAVDEHTLMFPDYRGNNMFTTLGNLAVSPRAGFAVIDFEAGRVLSMTGEARLVMADGCTAGAAETGRLCLFSVQSLMEFPMHAAETWSLPERSPFNPPVPTGTRDD